MEKIKNIKGINLVKISLVLLFFLVALPSNAKAIVILFFGMTTLTLVFQRKWYFNRSFFITNALLYITILLTVFYSNDIDYAIKKLLTMVSLLVFPFIFAMFTKEERNAVFKNLNRYLLVYLVAVFLFNTFAFIWFYITKTNYTFADMMQHFPTLIEGYMGKFSIHPIYLSMHCSIAILFSFYVMKEFKSKALIATILAMDITLVLFLMLYAKKGPLIALIVVFSLFVAFQRRKKLLKPYLLGVTLLIVLTLAIPKTRNKFTELLKIEDIREGEVTSTNIRYTIYEISKDLIKKAPIMGYGIGDYNNTLMQQYIANNNTELIKGRYNAHNQYLSLFLIGGIFSFLALVIFMGVNLVYAIRFDNQVLILLLIFYGIVMFTENILERETGVIYFSFFLSFFSMYNRDDI